MKNYKVSVMLITKYQHNLCRPQGSWQEDGRLGEEGFDQQGEMPTISRETQSWRFILCYGNNMSTLPRLRLLTQHCRWRRSTSWGKRMGGTTGQVHATEAKNHFATWSQKWRQWSWTPCEAQTEGNFGMPPSKPNHLCCWPHKIGACLAFLAQLCLGFHLIFAKEHIGSLFLSCFVF